MALPTEFQRGQRPSAAGFLLQFLVYYRSRRSRNQNVPTVSAGQGSRRSHDISGTGYGIAYQPQSQIVVAVFLRQRRTVRTAQIFGKVIPATAAIYTTGSGFYACGVGLGLGIVISVWVTS